MPHFKAHHCAACGTVLVRALVEDRERSRCPACRFVAYENPASAAAGLVLDPGGRVLLVRRAIEPFLGSWALPAGYQEVDESPAEAAAREIREETGVEVEIVSLFDLLFVADDPRRPANLAVFLCRPKALEVRPGPDALEAGWFALEALPAPIAFDNEPRILDRLRRAP